MSTTGQPLRIGFIPLADAAALLIAVDKGYCADEGLAVELVREVSWSNMRDKLHIGLFDAAHMIAPLAIASSLGLGHIKVPLVGVFGLGVNGNAITVSPSLHAALAETGAIGSPLQSAQALARVVAARKAKGEEPLTFGMTFPFSTHNYQLRYWMAAGGVDPDEDVRLVVLSPPYMVDSLKNGHVDAFCVGAPWNSVAVDLGVGVILHFGAEILARAAEKILTLRRAWAAEHPDVVAALVRAHIRAADFIERSENRGEILEILSRPDRIGVAADVIGRTFEGALKVTPDGEIRRSERYLLIGREGAARPDPVQAAWLYAQMVRWRQTPFSAAQATAAKAVFDPGTYDAAGGLRGEVEQADRIGAFAGPAFKADDIPGYLSALKRL